MAPLPLPPPAHLWARALRAADALLRTLFLGTALLGLLVTPPLVSLVLAPALAGIAVVVLASFVWYVDQRTPSRSTLRTAGTATAALIPFGHAVHALQSVGTVLALTVVALLLVATLGRLARWAAQQPGGTGGGRGALDDPAWPLLLQAVPLDALLGEWRELADPGDARRDAADAAHARRLLLDELQRRDPAAFAAWLAAGAAGPPDEHFRDDRGLAA